MARGIDHLVLAVHGLDHARKVYTRMGFTLTPTAQHPFGTYNSLVQLEGCFLELLGMRDPRAIPPIGPGAFSFARFHHHFLERREGMSMLVLETADADADAAEYARLGLQTFLPFGFEREAGQPDGTTKKVGFRTAFVTDPWIPEAAFFVCQNLYPENFWNPAYQVHPNGATTIGDVVMIARDPADHHALYEKLTGVRSIRSSSSGIDVETPRGRIRVMTPNAVERRWGEAVDVGDFATPRFAAFTIKTRDLGLARAALEKGQVPHEARDDRLIVPESAAFGTAIAFVSAT